jgi:hypothetical protein
MSGEVRSRKKRKQFFFEKKNQKTFVRFVQDCGRPCGPTVTRNEQKFFVSFFQKRNTSFLQRGINARKTKAAAPTTSTPLIHRPTNQASLRAIAQ